MLVWVLLVCLLRVITFEKDITSFSPIPLECIDEILHHCSMDVLYHLCIMKWMNKGHCYKKVDTKQAIASFRASVKMLCDAGCLSQAARLSKEIAELFENDED